jgi:hypothetical protein
MSGRHARKNDLVFVLRYASADAVPADSAHCQAVCRVGEERVLAYDFITLHLLKADRDFATRLRGDSGGAAIRGRSSVTTPHARLH